MTRRELEEPTRRDHVAHEDIDEQELKRRYYERLSDWSEPRAVKINRNGKLVDPLAELRKRLFKLP